jgi:hypothetical protein
VIGPPKWIGEAASHDELVALLRERQTALQLSDQTLDALAGLTHGHISKLLGPGRARGLSEISMNALLGALAVRFVIVEDAAQVVRMKPHWEGKDMKQVRLPARIGAALMKRMRPVVLRELGRRAGQARWRGIDPKLRSRRMSELARLRWDANRVASRPEPQQETAPQ